jgi:hypothetical protein
VPAENRAAIMGTVPQGARLDASTALAWVGAVLAGVALIAFVAANWAALPRLLKFALLIGLYGASAGGAAWFSRAGRPNAANGLLTFAAFAFAAAVGLTGQIFDIAGDERTALYAAGLAAAALALAGRGSGPAIAAVFLVAAGDFAALDNHGLPGGFYFPWLFVAAPAATALAMRWRSIPLAHGAALGLVAAAVWLGVKLRLEGMPLVAFAAALAVLAAAARQLRERGAPTGSVFYGWLVWGALGFYMLAGIDSHDLTIVHRLGWLLLAGALVALGRRDRHGAVTAAGVLGLVIGVSVVMYDLGLGLMTASAVFFAAAIAAVVAGLALRRRRPA